MRGGGGNARRAAIAQSAGDVPRVERERRVARVAGWMLLGDLFAAGGTDRGWAMVDGLAAGVDGEASLEPQLR